MESINSDLHKRIHNLKCTISIKRKKGSDLTVTLPAEFTVSEQLVPSLTVSLKSRNSLQIDSDDSISIDNIEITAHNRSIDIETYRPFVSRISGDGFRPNLGRQLTISAALFFVRRRTITGDVRRWVAPVVGTIPSLVNRKHEPRKIKPLDRFLRFPDIIIPIENSKVLVRIDPDGLISTKLWPNLSRQKLNCRVLIGGDAELTNLFDARKADKFFTEICQKHLRLGLLPLLWFSYGQEPRVPYFTGYNEIGVEVVTVYSSMGLTDPPEHRGHFRTKSLECLRRLCECAIESGHWGKLHLRMLVGDIMRHDHPHLVYEEMFTVTAHAYELVSNIVCEKMFSKGVVKEMSLAEKIATLIHHYAFIDGNAFDDVLEVKKASGATFDNQIDSLPKWIAWVRNKLAHPATNVDVTQKLPDAHLLNHIHDMLVRAFLKTLGYRGPYYSFLSDGTEDVDWLTMSIKPVDLGYDRERMWVSLAELTG